MPLAFASNGAIHTHLSICTDPHLSQISETTLLIVYIVHGPALHVYTRMLLDRIQSITYCILANNLDALSVGDRGDMSPSLFEVGGTSYGLSPPLFL